MAIFSLGLILCLSVSGVFSPHAVVNAAPNSTFEITEAQLLEIAPSSRSCENMTRLPLRECRTAKQAVPLFNRALRKYNVESTGEVAALISLIAFESGEFKYQRSRPKENGRGTRNMQSSRYNALYAFAIDELWPALSRYLDPTFELRMDEDTLLELILTKDEYDFASAAWFLTSQCGSFRAALGRFDNNGWESYTSQCLRATMTDARRHYWEKAQLVLNQP